MRALLFPALLLLAPLVPLVPVAATDACGAMCVEDCDVSVYRNGASAGCVVAHDPKFLTLCTRPGCDDPALAGCHALAPYGAYVLRCGGVLVDSLARLDRCEQVFYGPDIEDHVCVDSSDQGCMVYWEQRLPSYAKTCLVGLP